MLKRSVQNMVGEMADGAITSGTKLGVSMMVEIVARILVARNAKMILLRLRKLLLSKYKILKLSNFRARSLQFQTT